MYIQRHKELSIVDKFYKHLSYYKALLFLIAFFILRALFLKNTNNCLIENQLSVPSS